MKNISYSEIDGALSFYELGSNIPLFPSIVGFGGGGLAMLGGAGIYGLAGFASWMGLGTFSSAASFGLITGGVGLALVRVGIGAVCLINYFDNKKKEKEGNKSEKKTFEEKLNDPNSSESLFYNKFLEELSNYLNQKLTILIKNEYKILSIQWQKN